MPARQVKRIDGEHRCDRCQQQATVRYECSFTFRQRYAYWKALWQAVTGRRFTNKRKAQLGQREGEIDLKALSDTAFWMDLCPACWNACSQPFRSAWPMEFYHCVLGALNIPADHEVRVKGAETFVRRKTDLMAPGEIRRPLGQGP